MTSRQCFPCTACCDGWLTAEIFGVKIKPGVPCMHSTKQGCGIYENRPENPCVKFMCAWLQDETLFPEHMKPSECGAIVRFSDWNGFTVIRATPVGKKIPAETLEWLMALASKESIPLIFGELLFQDGKYFGVKRTGYGPPSFIQTVEAGLNPEDIIKF